MVNSVIFGQTYKQRLSGRIVDSDSRTSIAGATVEILSVNEKKLAVSDSTGRFSIALSAGRHSIKVSCLGYQGVQINDILIITGKESFIIIEMTESLLKIDEVVVRDKGIKASNSMASVSSRKIRSHQASKFAGVYYDPSRIVLSMAGVSSGNDDGNNQLIIRGNSPKGILWRLEGIEIPNPNHLADGEGSSSGAYSGITSNALNSFDFYTGAFPAEYSNAVSGVMELNLKSGNTEKKEYSVGVSVVGAEATIEGPLLKSLNSSLFADVRYSNFDILKRYGVIKNDELGIIPSAFDWSVKVSFALKKAGTIDFFSAGGSSKVGDYASNNADSIKRGADNDEFFDKHFFMITGIKHTYTLPSSRTNIRTTAGFTFQKTESEDYRIDTSLNKTLTYLEKFRYPALRSSVLVTHKFNPSNTLKIGISFSYIFADMFAHRIKNLLQYDTLVNTRNTGWYNGYSAQWKFKPSEKVEINTGMNFFHSGITGEFLAEPRAGISYRPDNERSFSAGIGFNSRIEPLSLYNYSVKISKDQRVAANEDLKSTKAFHTVLGANRNFGENTKCGFELYCQMLYDVPVSISTTSQYSVLNLSYGLPDMPLSNNGKGVNLGAEFSIEKEFANNYYFLANVSLLDSRYKAADGIWYSTYYNSGYILNATAGKEFLIGRENDKVFGINLKAIFRGGFRYTPVNTEMSLQRRKIIYDISRTYGKHLPPFGKIDIGFSYRKNFRRSSLSVLIETQNASDRQNVIRKRFSYQKGIITERLSYSLGLIPVGTVKIDF